VLAETVTKYGAGAMRAELKHPGVGVRFASSLGDDGIAIAEKLTTDQAIAISRHVDDIAKLPPTERNALLSMISEQSDRFATFVGDFVKQNPGKTLFTASGTAVVLANKDAIFGGDEIVFDKDGNPIVVSKQGLVERAAARTTTEVSNRVISPIVSVFVPLAALIVASFSGIKLFGVWKRQQQALASKQEPHALATDRIHNLSRGGMILFGKIREVAAHQLQRITFFVDFFFRAKSHPSQNGKRWTPALNRMLQQKSSDRHWQKHPTAIHESGKNASGAGERGRIRFEGSFDIPLVFQFFNPGTDCLFGSVAITR
jgi:hypothetical protein